MIQRECACKGRLIVIASDPDRCPNGGYSEATERDKREQATLLRKQGVNEEDQCRGREHRDLRADDIEAVHEPTLSMIVSIAGWIMSISRAG